MVQSAIIDQVAENVRTLKWWASLPEDEPGEFVEGRIVEEEVPDCIHELVVAWFVEILRRWIVVKGGLVFGSDVKFAVKSQRGRKPDASVYLPGRPKPPARGIVSNPPDIMLEVVSTSRQDARRDRVEKMQEYAAFGVRWYWIFDPQTRLLEMFQLQPSGLYAHVLGAGDGELNAVPGCEGLTLNLDALFAEMDQLEPAEAVEDAIEE